MSLTKNISQPLDLSSQMAFANEAPETKFENTSPVLGLLTNLSSLNIDVNLKNFRFANNFTQENS